MLRGLAGLVRRPASRAISRRARVKGVPPVDYYRARCKATHVHVHMYIRTRVRAHTHTWWHIRTLKSSSHHDEEGNGGRKKEGEGTLKSRTRETRESPGKPATALDGRRDHTLTSTPTFQGPPPDTYLTFLVQLLHLIHHLRSRILKSERRGGRETRWAAASLRRRARDSTGLARTGCLPCTWARWQLQDDPADGSFLMRKWSKARDRSEQRIGVGLGLEGI